MSDLELRRYSNRAPETTTLVSSISATDLSFDVVTTTGYPDPPFTIECEGEIMLVTNVAGLTLTVERAYDNSISAASHPAGAEVKHVLTADDFNHRWQDVIVTFPYGTDDNEYDDGSHSDLTKVNLGTTTWTESNGVLSCLFEGQSTNQVSAAIETLSAISIGSGVETAARGLAAANYAAFGPLFASGSTTTDNVIWQHVRLDPGTSNLALVLRSGTYASASTTHFTLTVDPAMGGWIYMRLVWVSVNTYRAWWSIDGVSWTDFGTGNLTISGVNPPTRRGVGVSSIGGSGKKLASFEYTRIWTP